jgi:hypothetical protein
MTRIKITFLFIFCIALSNDLEAQQESSKPAVPKSDLWLTYSGAKGPGKGRHVVLIAAEQEYRSEQSMPMLAKVLSKHHGFDCTVLFSVNEKGEVDPTMPAPFKDKTKRHNIPGLRHLAKADCVIWISRFMHLSEEQMQHFYDYFDSGKPLIALRTANHGSWGITAVGIVKQRVASLFLITRSILFWSAWKAFGERPMFTDVITTRTLSRRIARHWFWGSR